MKKALLITGVLLALTASLASAAGLNMYWTDCGPAGATNRTFSCTTNTGNHDIFMSFDPPQAIPQLTGNNQFIDLQSAGAALPDWWQFKNAGTCRALNASTPSIGPGSCADTWGGQDSPGIAAYLVTANTPSMAPNRARLIGSVAVPGAAATPVAPGTEYYSMAIRINSGKTVGSPACAGCQTAVCLVLNDLTLSDINANTYTVNTVLTSNFITWQGQIGGAGCPGTVPTVNKTWGQVKSIYR
ncbi:MAG TPA: hypothetical protein VJY35_11760 [Candidatus Eisenbacteria bacterium]|nr:hypothetical protein [Candidatus Eisenbacteria bacterium]